MLGETSIIHKSYKFYLLLYAHTSIFPKKDRYTLGQKCELLVLEFIELILETNAQPNSQKLNFLKKLDVKLQVIKIMIRLCLDTKAIDQRKYIQYEEVLQEIGRMLGGWAKSLKKENPSKSL